MTILTRVFDLVALATVVTQVALLVFTEGGSLGLLGITVAFAVITWTANWMTRDMRRSW